MEIVFIVGSLQALFFAVLVFSKKQKSTSDYILGFWLLLFCIHLLFPFFAYQDYPKYAGIGGTDGPLFLAHVVMLYLYTQSLIKGFQKKHLLHLIPVVIAYIVMLPYIILPAELKQQIGNDIDKATPYLWIFGLMMLSFCSYYIRGVLHEVKNHQRKIRSLFSYEELINLRWISILGYGFFAILITTLVLISSMFVYHLKPLTGDYISYSMIVIFIYMIGYWGYRQNRIFVFENSYSGFYIQKLVKKPDSPIKDITEDDLNFRERLYNYMVSEKPYLNGKLSLIELANNMNTTTHYISHILNNVANISFYDYVNSFRLEEVKQNLTPENIEKYTILGIAYNCGFNSKATFNRIFKNNTGLSPSEYISTI